MSDSSSPPRMTEGCASQRHTLDRETSAFIQGGWQWGSLSNSKVPSLASGTSQRRPGFTSCVSGTVASPLCPLGLPGMFGALLTFFPFSPASSSPELRKHTDTAQRTNQMSTQGHPAILTLLIFLQQPPAPPLTHHLLLLASSPSISASSLFLKHTEQAPDLGPLHSCVWLMPSSPSHLWLKYMFTNVHSSTVHNC